MEPPVFYASPENISSDTITLSRTEAHHAVSVLRLSPGAIVLVVNGLGLAYRGELTQVSRTKATVKVHSEIRNLGEPSVRLTLAAGLSAADKFDTVVQRGTELGVKRFVPVLSEKSRVKIDSQKRSRTRVTRLERVALAAMKQCRRSYLPEIASPLDLELFLHEQNEDDLKLVFHPHPAGQPLDRNSLQGDTSRVTILVGPEAGFTADELSMAGEAGFVPITLGPRILRTETAGPVATALVLQLLGEFS